MRRAAALSSSAAARSTTITTRAIPSLARRMSPSPIAAERTRAAKAANADGPTTTPRQPQQPILLLDVMDTLVSDPFYEAMPRHFGMPFRDLLEAKHPTAWLEFERGEIGEEALLSRFFRDGRPVDGDALIGMMKSHYRLLDGIEPLLDRLKEAGVEMHACSNYPVWWRNVEEATGLSRWLSWTFVSCEGPMRGRRKPSPEAFAAVSAHLGVDPRSCVFVDDRAANVEAAAAFGMRAVRFEGCATALEKELREHGLEF